MLQTKILAYAQLMRLDKPIGIFLLLWPTLWALWVAAEGNPSLGILIIFLLGVVVMRSAGCVINDFADRHFDGAVNRTKNRPLVKGTIKPYEALLLFLILCLLALSLALQLNLFTIKLAVVGVGLTIIYPFTKRFTYFPQVILGIVFGGWPVIMAFAAIQNTLPTEVWLLFVIASCWPLMYDTLYALVDQEDDRKIGVKSTAIWLGQYTQWAIALLQLMILLLLIMLGYTQQFSMPYYISLTFAAGTLVYQQYLLTKKNRQSYFKAFLNNNWFGLFVFIAFFLSYRVSH